MKIFFDCEFTGLRQNTTLVSFGCVTEDGRTFYAECTDYDQTQVDEWLADNVLKHLYLTLPPEHPAHGPAEAWATYGDARAIQAKGPRAFVAGCLKDWLTALGPVEMWGDCLAYDWVLFCELFGGSLPRNVSYIPMDLCTYLYCKALDPDLDRGLFARMAEYTKHNALADALVIKACYERARGYNWMAGVAE